MNLAELANLGFWTSGSRIFAGYRMAIAGEGGAIPPDVAAVVTVLQEREQARFAEFVGTLRGLDGDLNEEYARSRRRGMPAVPAGQSVLDPFYYQNQLLQSTPVIEDEWVWHDMPQELYVANDPDLTDEERAILQDLMPEYTVAARKAAAGETVHVADLAKVELAKSIRYDVLPSVGGFGIEKLNPETVRAVAEIARKVIWSLTGLFAVAIGGTMIVTWLKNRPAVAVAENEATRLAGAIRENQAKIEMTRRLCDYCVRRLELGGTQLGECNDICTQLGGLEPLDKPGKIPAIGCGFGRCWPWAFLGVGAGALIGAKLAKRYGLARKGVG